MTKDQYLRMVEQTGEEIDWDRCPPDADDFPESVVTAIEIYNSLGDKMYPDVGYTGKDFTNLDILFRLYDITSSTEKDWALELLFFMESIGIKESQKQIKAAYDKAKR
jgi:hypothetical protein